jgi:2-polyprenyl-3-methyl-5-hydroxy-6-metoxy-1,4-benzoquinol methylase
LAKANGLSVTYSELDSITRNYAIKRINDSGALIKIEKLEYDKPDLQSDTRCIVCTEVLEHIYEPELLLRYFSTKLADNGILVVSESFDYTENFCTHLPKHKGKSGKYFLDYMESIGFEKLNLEADIHPIIFRKMRRL